MSQYNPAALPEGGIFHHRYQIVRCIKAGGMGAVYEVVHLETRRRRALKVMLPSMVANPEMRERFKLEATVAAEIESDHIVETFDAGVDPETGAPFLVMELLRGEDLSAVLARRGRLGPEETVQILAQAAKALDKTHAAGIVHRDLKPDNLFLVHRDDDPPRLKILDFGIAKVVAQATEAQTRSIGTPVYMAPEQIKGARLGPWTDLYALGHIAYQLLVGEAYWGEDLTSQEAIYPLLLRINQGPTEPPAARAWRRRQVAVTPAFEAWFVRATAVDASARFAPASAMIAALAEALGVAGPPVSRVATGGQGQVVAAASAPVARVPSGEVSGPAGAPGVGVSAPFTSDRSVPLPVRSNKLPVLVAAALLATGAAITFTVVFGMRHASSSLVAPLDAAPAAAPASAPSSVPVLTAAPAPTVAPAVVEAATAPTATPARTGTVPTSKRLAGSPAAPTNPSPAATPTPAPAQAPAAKNCTPPYTIDAAGHRQYKPECL